jgi:hypothetical protein
MCIGNHEKLTGTVGKTKKHKGYAEKRRKQPTAPMPVPWR